MLITGKAFKWRLLKLMQGQVLCQGEDMKIDVLQLT